MRLSRALSGGQRHTARLLRCCSTLAFLCTSVAGQCGHDPAVLLRAFAKRTRKADTSAAAVIGTLSKNVLGGG
jgi:hypothetical protein